MVVLSHHSCNHCSHLALVCSQRHGMHDMPSFIVTRLLCMYAAILKWLKLVHSRSMYLFLPAVVEVEGEEHHLSHLQGITSRLHHSVVPVIGSPGGAGGGGGGVAGTPPLLELSLLKLSRLGFWATRGEGRAALLPLVSRRPPIAGAGAGGGALSRGDVGPEGREKIPCCSFHLTPNAWFIRHICTWQWASSIC